MNEERQEHHQRRIAPWWTRYGRFFQPAQALLSGDCHSYVATALFDPELSRRIERRRAGQ
jgi:hypothetical protein